MPACFRNSFFLKRTGIYILFFLLAMQWQGVVVAQQVDTLPAVKLHSKKLPDVVNLPVPVQQFNKAELDGLNSLSVADAVKFFSGVLVKDYGGIGGLKTISVRSLGANHTAVLYDGVAVGDAQGGQIDLGKFSLDNIESIQLFSTQPPDILMPARSFASASVLSLHAQSAERQSGTLTLKLKGGSFGFINPSLSYRMPMIGHFSQGIQAEYQQAHGKYPYINYENGQSSDKRINSDVKSYRVEYDAAYIRNDSNAARLKLYYYDSKRGLPGSVILYNNISAQRLNNKSFFTQFSWNKTVRDRGRLLINAKYASDDKYYLDPAYSNSAGLLENNFHLRSGYASVAYRQQFSTSFSASVAVDYFIDQLNRSDSFVINFPEPSRYSFLQNIALRFKKQRFEADAQLLHTGIREKVKIGLAASARSAFTPAFAVSGQPFGRLPVRLRLSYKRIFRAPTFDDLYYTNIGNTNLLPEYVHQFNAGITYARNSDTRLSEFRMTADAYLNQVTNKIIAVPRQNLFQWTMSNIGKARIRGLDVSAHGRYRISKEWQLTAGISYSLQEALDVTNPLAYNYKAMLPYTPKHSGSFSLAAGYRSFTWSYNIISSAYRYRQGDLLPVNLVQGWADHSTAIRYSLKTKQQGQYVLLAEFNNLFNNQYEVIRYYPMPRLNYRLGITANFKHHHKQQNIQK